MLDTARWWRLVLAGSMLALTGCPTEKTPSAPPPAKDTVAAVKESSPREIVTPVAAAEKPAEPPPAAAPAATPPTAKPPSVAGTIAKTPEVTKEKPAEPPATPPAPAKTRGDKHAKVDPVKINGPIFEAWSKPQAALLISGEQLGYMEPCGCAGLENQKGGLSRRYTLLNQLRAKGWPLVPLDLGGFTHRFGQQAEIKFQTTVEALKAMDYAGIGWGPEDLRLGAGILLSAAIEADGKPSRFTSANVGLFELNSGTTSSYRVIEAGGRKIGVTSVLSKDMQAAVKNDEIKFADPDESLAAVLPKLKAEADYLVLLSYAEPQESERLAKKFPDFNVVVTARGADEPPREAKQIEGTKTLLAEVGHKGMYAVVLGLFDDKDQPLRYQRVPIDSRFANAPEIHALMVGYQDQLKALGWKELGLRPAIHPRAGKSGDALAEFVGSEQCAKCHTKAYAVWKDTTHAHATETLIKLDPPRQFDPECISCHATGWKPQEFVPYETGFLGMDETPHLKGNGCENCHGPGGAHVKAEAGSDTALRDTLRKVMATPEENQCAKCHDLDNSPKFDLTEYWLEIQHSGKD